MTKLEINHINSADVELEKTTDVMKQYLKIKKENEGSILLYRLGDFYETFFEDAELLSRELELTLTGRDAGKFYGRVPLAGIPVKAVENYLEKLVEKGYKIAVCEQLEDPKQAKGLVQRGVVRTITAGTLVESRFLNQSNNNYICALFEEKGKWGFAYTDISTGEFKAATLDYNSVLTELARIKPSEVIAPVKKLKLEPFQIVPEEIINLPDEILNSYNCAKVPTKVFEENFAQSNLKNVLKINTLDGLGYNDNPLAYRASAGVLAYIWENMREGFPKFERIEIYELTEFVSLDVSTRKNLELTETLREKNKYGSLLWAIDKTVTSMGARLLKSWICQPLKSKERIIERQNRVQNLANNSSIRVELAQILHNIYDIQRLSTRVSNNSANPRDYVSLKDSLVVLPKLIEVTRSAGMDIFDNVLDSIPDIEQFVDIIDKTIVDNPPITLKEGGVIKSGVNSTLDYLRGLMTNGEEWLKKFEEEEREKTGISALKVGYNKVFGYYIEVTNSHLNKVPASYVRRQTLTGGERYITDTLKRHEDEVLTAQVKANELEYRLYSDFREYSKEFVSIIREISKCVAELDVYNSFATIAVERNYVCPIIDDSLEFVVKNGRHPVLEKILPLGSYVANDLELSDEAKTRFMILTGPNMAGKSTYMRQNALIVILAQIGSFVPADWARIGIVDKIFTRVGASDDLTLGQSTFMVEMSETSYILNNATNHSLILIDEIGRGTSTYDGVAIAWSVAEYIATVINARCIFATHYHELNVMTKSFPQIKNFRITVTEENGEIEFLRKIVQGGASKSYGIQVAKMAGLPNAVINRSQELMNKLQKDFSKNLAGKKSTKDDSEIVAPQLNLF
jgi:DNA mismatch repair protein MutS